MYGQYVPSVYLTKSNIGKISGDEISDTMMPFQIGMLGLMFLFLLTGLYSLGYAQLALIPLGALLISFIDSAHRIAKTIRELLYLILIFFVRTVAWGFGILFGLIKVF